MLITLGDFVDLYLQLRLRKPAASFFFRIFIRAERRTLTWWSRRFAAVRGWWDIPSVVCRLNEKITGNPSTPYIQYVGSTFFGKEDSVRLLSIGCGRGSKEIEIAVLFPRWKIEGFDVSAARIDAATESARKKGIGNVSFFTADLMDFSFPEDAYDIILFDSSLHHFKDFDYLFEAIIKSLKKDGIVVINEYTGPDRFQWTRPQLQTANTLLGGIPPRYRRLYNLQMTKRRVYRPGFLRMVLSDPSEAVNSSRILPSLHKHFVAIKETALGGNLLHPILKDIAVNFIEEDETTRSILKRLFEEEDRFIECHPSDFTFGIYGKRR